MKLRNRVSMVNSAVKPLLIAVLIVLVAAVTFFRSGNAQSPEIVNVSNQSFGSVRAAQEVVPFTIMELQSPPQGMTLTGVGVTTAGDNVRVDVLYQSRAGSSIELIQSNREMNTQGPAVATSSAEVNGSEAEVITGTNQTGTEIGIVHWTTENISYILIANHESGPSLVPLARSIATE